MTGNRPLAVATAAALTLLLGGAALAQQAPPPGTNQQASPAATAPIPAEGPGQAVMGAAVGGSAPGPAAPSPTDNSQAQQGVLLKPGQGAGDMGAAAGAKPAQ